MRRKLRLTLADAAQAMLESAKLRPSLLSWLLSAPHRTVAAFSPLPGEVDLLPLLQEMPDLRWVLPRVQEMQLVFHLVTGPADLQPGAFGIAEPREDAPVVRIDEIDVFLCPGLGFTPEGTRMGRGKGFYDRALAHARVDAIRIGVTFASQVIKEIPTEPHDLPMHYLATSDGVMLCHH